MEKLEEVIKKISGYKLSLASRELVLVYPLDIFLVPIAGAMIAVDLISKHMVLKGNNIKKDKSLGYRRHYINSA